MEETLPIDYTCSETDDESGGPVMAAVGCLKVLAKDGEKERCYPVFKGTNTVGRSTSCQICIPIKAISKHHATILVEKDSHFLQDNNSKNHTRRNKVLLKSQAYYELSNNCDLLFGDCACTYYTGKEHWEAFVAKRDDDSQTLCETITMTTETAMEEPLPVTPAARDPRVAAGGSHDVTDGLFSPNDDVNDKTLPVMTEHTQLLLTTDADGPMFTNGSDSAGSSPLLADQDNEATQLIPHEEIATANRNEIDGHDEPTIAYPIDPTARSPSNSPMDDNDIDATIPYDMTQGVNLLTKCRFASNSSDAGDIENTIPYEMTQGVLGSNLTDSPTSKRSPVDEVEPTVPYDMSDASSPGCDAVEGVAEPTLGVADPTVHMDEPMVGVADPTARMDEPTVGVADPTAYMDEPTVGVADSTARMDEPTVGVAEPTVRTDEPTAGVADPTTHRDESIVGVAEPSVHADEHIVGVANSTVNMVNPTDDLDETQSIDNDDNVPTMCMTDPVVGVADAMDDNDATQTIDVGVAELDTGDANTTADQHEGSHDESAMDHFSSPDHIPPATSPTPSSPKTSPVHKATPILKNVASPKSPTPKKVHFEPAKPPTLRLSTSPPLGSRATVSLDDEESPDVELPPSKPLLESHPPLNDDDNKATAATVPTTRGGARRKGKAKSETARSTRTRSSTAKQDKDTSNKDGPENKRGGARNKSARNAKAESTATSKTRRNATEKTKDEKRISAEGAASGESSTSKGKTTAKKGRAQPSKRGGKQKAADPSTDSDETPSVTPITTPINESPSFLTDTDALFSGGGRIKRKYTDFLSPKRDHLFRSPKEEMINKESTTTSPSSSNDLISTSHDLPTTSHDPPTESHDPSTESPLALHDPAMVSHDLTAVSHNPNTVSHDPTTVSHDPTTVSHDPVTASHDPATSSHDAVPKVLFTGIVDEDGQKVVEELGGELVESVYDCTHLVTDDKLRRTLKLLCCISRGCPIIGTQWLKKCKQQKKFVSAEPFIIKDKTFEKQHKCSLSASLARARVGPPLLQNQQFYMSVNVQPPPSDMADIIKCSGGEVLDRMPLTGSDNVFIVTCDADLNTCRAASEGGVSLYSSEYLLSGILRQQMDPESHRLIVKDEERKPGKNKRRASSSSSSNESSTKRRRK